jgi:hypothetical protein
MLDRNSMGGNSYGNFCSAAPLGGRLSGGRRLDRSKQWIDYCYSLSSQHRTTTQAAGNIRWLDFESPKEAWIKSADSLSLESFGDKWRCLSDDSLSLNVRQAQVTNSWCIRRVEKKRNCSSISFALSKGTSLQREQYENKSWFSKMYNVRQSTRSHTSSSKGGEMISLNELEWVAGFLEAEGSFYWGKSGIPQVTASQVEEGPIRKLKDLFGGSLKLTIRKDEPNRNPIYRWFLTGKRAVALSMTLYSLLSSKRQWQIRGTLAPWRMTATARRYRTHCSKGHPYAGENLYVDRRGKRFCRTCLNFPVKHKLEVANVL